MARILRARAASPSLVEIRMRGSFLIRGPSSGLIARSGRTEQIPHVSLLRMDVASLPEGTDTSRTVDVFAAFSPTLSWKCLIPQSGLSMLDCAAGLASPGLAAGDDRSNLLAFYPLAELLTERQHYLIVLAHSRTAQPP